MKQCAYLVVGFLVFSLLAVSGARAIALDYYGIEDTLQEDLSVNHKVTLQFDSPINRLDYTLGFRITNLSVEKNFPTADCTAADAVVGSTISCTFAGMTPENNQLKLLFTTRGPIREVDTHYQYAVNYGISLPVNNMFALIRLPRNGILANEANASYIPADGKILTDGKVIMVFWNAANLTSGDNLQFSVDFGLPILDTTTSLVLLYGITAAVVLALIGLLIYSRRAKKAEVTKTELIASVLNEDEKRVVDIVAAAGGKVGQKVIVRDSGFSKAKVSRLVKSMKARNILDIEPISGRENRILLHIGEKKSETAEQDGEKDGTDGDPA